MIAYQVRFQLPFWIAQKFWDFQAQRSYGRWTGSLKTWNVRPNDSEIFDLVGSGETREIRRAFETGSASLYDCNEWGDSLLDVSSDVYFVLFPASPNAVSSDA